MEKNLFIHVFFRLCRLCPKIAQYRDAFEKSPKFLAHYNNVTTKLFSDIKAALQVDNFGKYTVTPRTILTWWIVSLDTQ